MSEERPGRQYVTVEAHTNENGEYELPVPIGNVWLQSPDPPTGFWNANAKPLEQLAVSRTKRSAERNFQVTKGAVWGLKLETGAAKPVARAFVQIVRGADNSLANYLTDLHGECRFTVPRDGGKLTLGCGFLPFSGPKTLMLPGNGISLDIAPDFDAATA